MIIQGEDYGLKVSNRELKKFLENPKPLCEEILSIFNQGGLGCMVISSTEVLWNNNYLANNKGEKTMCISFPVTWSDDYQDEDVIMPIVEKYLKQEMDKFNLNWAVNIYDQYDVPKRFFNYMNKIQS